MVGGDYWDIEDFLAEEEPVSVLTSKELCGLGYLSPNLKKHDLPPRHKVEVPFWLAGILAQRNFATVSIPKFYAESYRASLKADPSILLLSDKSKYYFTLGCKLSALLMDIELSPLLKEAFMQRFRHVVANQELRRSGLLIRSLTELELSLMEASQRSWKELQEWRQRKFERIQSGMPRKRIRLS